MKKLSKVQLKQQAAVMSAVTKLEEKALAELAGVKQCWFDMDYDAFPGSLLVRVQFIDEADIQTAEPQLLMWRKRLAGLLLKKGILVKDMRRHLVFTLQDPDD
ncbi:hypothetical protein [Catenovulum adriaticum]|uniref:Uncharacterized protein n=1 Tax=Catenovulum adriaticum TaxID=2984846 RepID=A0ABY7APB2_9ALTE|nr:hypothetical protein [Catenovulum sp. TS8]WAJ71334.1 hypothetical protein OLW01_05925 [Catenovulum sp. TS8]